MISGSADRRSRFLIAVLVSVHQKIKSYYGQIVMIGVTVVGFIDVMSFCLVNNRIFSTLLWNDASVNY
jgi:hypothetical protein